MTHGLETNRLRARSIRTRLDLGGLASGRERLERSWAAATLLTPTAQAPFRAALAARRHRRRLDDLPLRFARTATPDRDRRAQPATPIWRSTDPGHSGCGLCSPAPPGNVGDPQVRPPRNDRRLGRPTPIPASDVATILLTLRCRLRRPRTGTTGERTIPAADFFTGPFGDGTRPAGAAHRDPRPKVEGGRYLKHVRRQQDWATGGRRRCARERRRARRVRRGWGADADPALAPWSMAVAGGATPSDAAAHAARGHARALSDVAGSAAEYRAHLARVLTYARTLELGESDDLRDLLAWGEASRPGWLPTCARQPGAEVQWLDRPAVRRARARRGDRGLPARDVCPERERGGGGRSVPAPRCSLPALAREAVYTAT
jgi:hypothetical protein